MDKSIVYNNKSILYCIGEALIDFIPEGAMQDGTPLLAPMPGGAAANTAVAAAKLGIKTFFIGKVGDDGFGHQLIKALNGYGVATDFMSMTRLACTTLAFVTLTPKGERDFTFARKPGADMMLSEDDIPDGLFSPLDILHFGSLGLAPDSPSKKAHKKAILLAKNAGALISFDPNIRLPLWDDPMILKETVLEHLGYADIIKVSTDEMPFIFDTTSEHEAAEFCFAQGCSVFFATRGENGASVRTPSFFYELPGQEVRAVDTTGAGDAFNGAVLSSFIGNPLSESLHREALIKTLNLANAAGSITVTRKGAMSGSPSKAELE